MEIIFIRKKPQISLEDIKEYEQQFNRKVPEDLKAFQLNIGTGIPLKNYYPTIDREDTDGVSASSFCDYNPDVNSIVTKTSLLQELNENIAGSVIPFVHSTDGFDFAMGCLENNLGKIFLLDYQHSDHPSIELIEDNLHDFLNKLQNEPTYA